MAKQKVPNYNDSTLSGRTQRQARVAQGLANAKANQAKPRTADKNSEPTRTRNRPNQASTGQSVDRGGFTYTRFGD